MRDESMQCGRVIYEMKEEIRSGEGVKGKVRERKKNNKETKTENETTEGRKEGKITK